MVFRGEDDVQAIKPALHHVPVGQPDHDPPGKSVFACDGFDYDSHSVSLVALLRILV